ncbi:type VI secretion system protein ImpK [Duganella sp. CF458]|uniref:DotU family type VI secretion system protein n=1 Tax=Duganella sp. CF458 TaxID=1884368 RepID=UPI0008E5645E|nr:DotU family type VI secretion system protein [Duganella sp. CF458]SFG09900.1 type VI secretion system protein ImpK [Duganella sp. CF458]
MSQDDPFATADAEHTIMVPTPGARQRPQPAQTPATQPSVDFGFVPAAQVSGLNALLAAANPLLNLVPQLRATVHHADPAGAKEFLATQVKEFERRAKAAGIANENIIAARYALCTLLDEAAASTPWGASGIWAKDSLLVRFHNEAWGGEKFFQLLSKLAETPREHRELLEFMYTCLALGLEGRYRVLDNGKAQLEALRERLALMLRNLQGDYERPLSPRWEATDVPRHALLATLPLWVAVGVLGLLLLAVYATFNLVLNRASDPTFTQIQNMRARPATIASPLPPTAPPAVKPRLAGFLAPEIEQGLVAVRDEPGRSTIIIRGDGLFAPGRAAVLPNYAGVLERIAAALKAVPGAVVVNGYTDDQAIRTTRFPSNWHLSQERAGAVAKLLEQKAAAQGRFSAEGHADANPVAPNNTPAGRARNRRVEIILTPRPDVQ